MNAVLDMTKQLARTKLTPMVDRETAMSERTVEKLGALGPASDEEAGAVAPVPLGLTAADIERLQSLGHAVAQARVARDAADRVLAAATTQARRLENLEARAGALAAQAFRGGQDAKQAAKAIAAEIEDARAAAAAVKELTRDRDAAVDAFHRARGALSGAATEAVRQAMLRASKRYAELALEVTQCLAAIDAGMLSIPSRIYTNLLPGWSLLLRDLSLPAIPEELRIGNGVETLSFRDSLLTVDHARLTAHRTAAVGRLAAQLREAVAPSGIDPRSLMA